MSSYWQKAKREAKDRAWVQGYCWVWSNPEIDWKHPFLFFETGEEGRPHGVPCHATRFGDGPRKPDPEPEIDRITLLEERVAQLEEQVQQLKEQHDEQRQLGI